MSSLVLDLSFPALWERFQREERQKAHLEELLGRARRLSTKELKATWDAFDCDAKEGEPGFFWPDDAPHIEDVHRVLNERGKGAYCAV